MSLKGPFLCNVDGSAQMHSNQNSCADPECFFRGGLILTTFFFFFFLVDEGRVDPNTTISGQSSARRDFFYYNAQILACGCPWRDLFCNVDGSAQMRSNQNSCADPECFFRGGPILTVFFSLFLVDEGRVDPNTTISGQSSARRDFFYYNAQILACGCPWRDLFCNVDGSAQMRSNQNLCADPECFFRGGPILTFFFSFF